MNAFLVCLSTAVLGIDYGWQPVAGGGIEYIIQIEPELLASLAAGNDLFSDLPPAVQNVRSYRITVGSGRLPHHGEPPPSSAVIKASDVSSSAGRHKEGDGGPAAELDLSQLPGPVLGPALIRAHSSVAMDDSAAAISKEPTHLEEPPAEPLHSRVAGYHPKQESTVLDGEPAATKKGEAKPNHRPSAGAERNAAAPAKVSTAQSTNQPDQPTENPRLETVLQLALMASLACNAFLLWVATGQRSRYRSLVRSM